MVSLRFSLWLLCTISILFSPLAWGKQSTVPMDSAGRPLVDEAGELLNYDTAPQGAVKAAAPLGISSLTAAPTNAVATLTGVASASEPFWQYGLFGTDIGSAGILVGTIKGATEVYVSGQTYPSSFWQVLRKNSATGNYDQVWLSPAYTGTIARIALGNVIGGPELEIVVALESGSVLFYDQETRTEVGRITTPAISDLRLADLNADGLSDLVVVSSSDLRAYNSAGTLLWQVAGATGTDLAVAQMDDDPGLEVAVTSGKVIDVATRQVQWTRAEGFGQSLATSDIDGDGRAELIASLGWYYVYAFDVDRQLSKWSITSDLDIGAIAIANVDADPAEELLLGDGQWGEIHAYNMATQTQKWEVKNPNHGVTNIAVGDVDADGVLEVLWGAGASSSGADNLYVASVQTQTIEWTSICLDGPFLGPVIGDLDGDGLAELVSCSSESNSGYDSGRILVFDLATRTLRGMSGPVSNNSSLTGIHDLQLRDVDGDGRAEILIGTDYLYNGAIEIYGFKADNSFTLKWSNATKPSGMPFSQVDAADIDGDGQIEIIAGNSKEHSGAEGIYVHVFDYATKALEWRSVNLSTSWTGVSQMVIGNLDGDANLEIGALIASSKIAIFDGSTRQQEAEIAGTFTALSANRGSSGGFLTGNASGVLVPYTPVAGLVPYKAGTPWTAGTESIQSIVPGPDNSLWVSLGGKLLRLDEPNGPVWTSSDYGDYFSPRLAFRKVASGWEVYGGTRFSVAGFLPPPVLSGTATAVASSSATLRGSVNPLGATTAVHYEYGTSPSFGNTITTTPSTVEGQTTAQVSAALTGLQAHSTYYYRLVAPGVAGGIGETLSFATSNVVPVAANRTVHAPAVGQSAVIFDPAQHASDPDGDALSVTVSSVTGSGSATVANGVVTYTNTAGFTGSVTVRLNVTDGFGGQLTPTVTISNTAPTANSNSFTAVMGANTFDVLANDSDADGDPLKITSVTTPLHGTAAIITGGTAISYDPVDTYVGSDNFSYTISDGIGGTRTTTVSVQVPDSLSPVITGTFSPLTLATGANGRAALPSYLAQATATDNVGVTSKTQSPVVGTLLGTGTTTITITAADAAKNSTSIQFNVLVNDATPPALSGTFAPKALVTGTGGQVALPDYASQAQASDNVGVTSVVQSPAGGSLVGAGQTNVTITASDAAGNTASKTFAVTVGDGTGPVVSGTFTPMTLTTGGGGKVALPDYASQAVTWDNVTVASLTQSPVAGTMVDAGSVTVNLTANDPSGNTGSMSFDVDVKDGTAPVVSGPLPEQTLVTDPEGTVKLPDFTSLVSATDNVGVEAVTQDPEAGTLLADGEHTVTFDVKDAAGNEATATVSVKVLLSNPLQSVVAYTGGPVPNMEGAVFTRLGLPALDGPDLLFSASFKSPFEPRPTPALFFLREGGPVTVVAGESAPGVPEATFVSFDEPIGNHGGAFLARIRGSGVTAANDKGLWTDAFAAQAGTWQLIAREGSAAPETFGARYKNIRSIALNDGPQLLWLAQLQPGIAGVNGTNDMVLFGQTSAGTPKILLREGQMLSIGGVSRVVRTFIVLAAPPGGAGDGRANGGGTAVLANFVGDKTQAIIHVSAGAEPEVKAFTKGQIQIPDLVEWQNLYIPAAINDSAMVFRARVGTIGGARGSVSRESLFLHDQAGAGLLFMAGDAALDSQGVNFHSFFDPAANDRGDIAFRARLTGPGIAAKNNEAIFSLRAGAEKPALVVRKGDPAPELPETTIAKIGAFALPKDPEGLRGTVFTATLQSKRGSVSSRNNFVLCAVDRDGNPRLLARTGAQVNVAGTVKTIAKIAAFSVLPGSPTQARTCGTEPLVTYRATFTDRSEALITVKVP